LELFFEVMAEIPGSLKEFRKNYKRESISFN